MAQPQRTSLDSILLKGTSLSKEELGSVYATPAEGDRTIGDLLKETTFKSADEAVGKLSRLLGVTFMAEVPYGDISGDIVREIPINYAKSNNVLPYRENKEEVLVFCSNPLNYPVLDDLRIIFEKK